MKVLRARNKFHRALSEWKDEVRRQRAAEKAVAQRAYESAKALLEDIEKAKDACAAAKASICVEINQCVGCDDAAVLAPSSGEEPVSPRHRAGIASTAWRSTRRFRTNAP